MKDEIEDQDVLSHMDVSTNTCQPGDLCTDNTVSKKFLTLLLFCL